MLEQELKDKNIPFIVRDGTKYYELKALKDKVKDIFIDASGIIEIDGNKYISDQFLRPKTDFDRAMNKLFRKS